MPKEEHGQAEVLEEERGGYVVGAELNTQPAQRSVDKRERPVLLEQRSDVASDLVEYKHKYMLRAGSI